MVDADRLQEEMIMASNITGFVWNRYNAVLLPLGTSNTRPGMLLHVEWPLIFGFVPPKIMREDGFAWDFLGKNENQFPSALVDANLIQEAVTDKIILGAAVALPQYGISADAEVGKEFTANIQVTGLKAKTFQNQASAFPLLQELLKLKVINPPIWRVVNDDLLVTEAYYVTSFKAEFHGGGNVSAKAAYNAGKIKLDGNLTGQWADDTTLQASGVPTVALAVRGLRV